MITLPKGDVYKAKGVWSMEPQPMVSCPSCGLLISLYAHKINPDGTIEPSVMRCRHEGCGFADEVLLEQWGV